MHSNAKICNGDPLKTVCNGDTAFGLCHTTKAENIKKRYYCSARCHCYDALQKYYHLFDCLLF